MAPHSSRTRPFVRDQALLLHLISTVPAPSSSVSVQQEANTFPCDVGAMSYQYQPVPTTVEERDKQEWIAQQAYLEAHPVRRDEGPPYPRDQRNVVVIQESASAEMCRYMLIGCCITWVVILLIFLILIIYWEETKTDDYY